MNTIGFVGLGAMGSRIASRLIATGHHVSGTNRTQAKAAPPDRARPCMARHAAPGGPHLGRRVQHGHR
jgi:3-hydroxyisobutyrate dehydrogenase-like beta-hydroxyacid dehydrogenase